MKHIKKKYLFEKQLKSFDIEKSPNYINGEINKDKLKKVSKSHNIILNTSEHGALLAFIYNDNGHHITMPLPDFTLVHFDFSYRQNIERKISKTELLSKLKDVKNFNEMNSEVLYKFYGYSSSCIINLFTSIECYINHLLPENKVYSEKKNNRTEIYNKTQIQENIPFWDKLKKVLPQFYDNKNFFSKPTPTNNHITKLKDLRDKIIHTKSDDTGELQIELFKQILNFKYDDTFNAVTKFMNFYEENYLEECPCDNNF